MLKYNPVKSVGDILAINSSRYSNLPTAPKLLDSNRTFILLKKQTYLGQPQPYGKQTRSGYLSPAQIKTLATLGINERPGTYYHRGLVTTQTHDGPIDIGTIHQYLRTQVQQVLSAPEAELADDVRTLMNGINLCSQAEMIAALDASIILQLLRKEHNIQLAQLGTLLLPVNFTGSLKEPVQFVETTAIKLGRLMELTFHDSNRQNPQ